MFYRRKILLALLEVFEGTLDRADCQKLLYLFCLRRGKNYYDFFPYKNEKHSLILSQDKARLTTLGFLLPQEDFHLAENQSFLLQLHHEDRQALLDLVSALESMIDEVPVCTVLSSSVLRSMSIERMLESTKSTHVSQASKETMQPCLFTIGYEGLSIDAYLNLLVTNNIKALVDVRKNPLSMKYGFSKTKLSHYTKLAGISYFHLPELGIPSGLRKNLTDAEAYRSLFESYRTQILPKQNDTLEKLIKLLQGQKRSALTCFEADHHFCHRDTLANYLMSDPDFNLPVFHLGSGCTSSKQIAYTVDRTLQTGLWN